MPKVSVPAAFADEMKGKNDLRNISAITMPKKLKESKRYRAGLSDD